MGIGEYIKAGFSDVKEQLGTIRGATQCLGTTALGTGTMLLTSAGVATKFGHKFIQYGPTNFYLIGATAAVYNLTAFVFTEIMKRTLHAAGKSSFKKYAAPISQMTLLSLLCGITVIAAKAHRVSGLLTQPGNLILASTSLIMGYVGRYVIDAKKPRSNPQDDIQNPQNDQNV